MTVLLGDDTSHVFSCLPLLRTLGKGVRPGHRYARFGRGGKLWLLMVHYDGYRVRQESGRRPHARELDSGGEVEDVATGHQGTSRATHEERLRASVDREVATGHGFQQECKDAGARESKGMVERRRVRPVGLHHPVSGCNACARR